LYLSYNPINSIHPEAFTNNTQLLNIYFQGHKDRVSLIKQLQNLKVDWGKINIYISHEKGDGIEKFTHSDANSSIQDTSQQSIFSMVYLKTINTLTTRIDKEYAENKKNLDQAVSTRTIIEAANSRFSTLSLNIVDINNIERNYTLKYPELLKDTNLMRINDSEFILIKDMFHSKLERLDLTGNKITEITKDTFSGLTELKVLSLSYNAIKSIDPDAFKDNTKLSNLDLKGNKITEITTDTFSGLTELQYLNLSYNPINSIDPDAFTKNPKLNTIDFTGNTGKLDKAQLEKKFHSQGIRIYFTNEKGQYDSFFSHQLDLIETRPCKKSTTQ